MMINVADLVDPDDPDGRTYRQVNAAKQHGIALGALVEIEGGARLFVVLLGRDCDQTPLYWLAARRSEPDKGKWTGGYPERDLVEVGAAAKIETLVRAVDAFVSAVSDGGIPSTAAREAFAAMVSARNATGIR